MKSQVPTPTQAELHIIDMTVRLANALARLPRQNPGDMPEAVAHLHAIQDQVAARCVYRVINSEQKQSALEIVRS